MTRTWLLTAVVAYLLGIEAPTHLLAQDNQPISITITGPQGPVTAGSECQITVETKNNSQGKIALKATAGEEFAVAEYETSVADASSGHPVPRAAAISGGTNGVGRPQHSSFQFKHLEPQETLTQTFRMNRFFDMSKPGRYTVQLKRSLPPELGGGTAASNIIVVTVSE